MASRNRSLERVAEPLSQDMTSSVYTFHRINSYINIVYSSSIFSFQTRDQLDIQGSMYIGRSLVGGEPKSVDENGRGGKGVRVEWMSIFKASSFVNVSSERPKTLS